MKFNFLSKWFPGASGTLASVPPQPVQANPASPKKTTEPAAEPPKPWYLATDSRKKLRQVVFEVNENNWVESRFATLVLPAKYGQLIMNNWITGLFRMVTASGPFLLIRTDGFVSQFKRGSFRIGFSFFQMSSGGIFAIYVEPKNRIPGTPHPFIEIVYGMDVEDNRRRIADTFEKDTLEIVLADKSDIETSFMDTGERFYNPRAMFDLEVPLPPALRENLQREWNGLLGYHATMPSHARDYNKAANEMWNLMPLEESPILRK
jgi:hypothetical protein